ncbi:MAG TPA: translocation/assembly module TamB domain-containing protein [Gammaproteobacteria bacterium]
MSGRNRHPILRRVALALLALVILLATLLTAAFYSSTAFRFALQTAQPFIPGELGYAAIDGTLAGPVHAENIVYKVSGTAIHADSLTFDISPWALLAGNVSLDHLSADELVVTLPPPDESEADKAPLQPRDILDALSLPMEISVDELAVNGFTLRDGNERGPLFQRGPDHEVVRGDLLQLETLRASLNWNAEQLAVTALDANGPQVSLTGDAVVGLASGHTSRIDLETVWRGGTFPVAGSIHGDGNAEKLDLVIGIREPAQATLTAQFHDLFDTPAWQGTLNIAELRPSTFRDSLPDVAWSGEFRFEGNAEDTHIEGTAVGGWPPATGVDLSLDAFVNSERVRVESLQTSIEGFGSELMAQGELHYADELSYIATGSVTSFAWPGLEAFLLRDANFSATGNAEHLELQLNAAAGENETGQLAVNGDLAFERTRFDADIDGSDLAFTLDGTRLDVAELDGTASGTPDDYEGVLQGVVQLNALPPARFTVQAQGDPDHVVADIENLQWLNGMAEGSATLAWRDAVQLDAQLRGGGFELARINSRVDGQLGGNISAQAVFGGEQPDVTLRIESLDGEIAGQTITGNGSIRLADGELMTQGLVIDAGEAHVELNDAASGFDFRINVPALALFHPDLGGQLQASGHFNGDLASPTVRLLATGNGVSWQDWQAGAFEADANIVNGGERDSFAQLEAADVEAPSITASKLMMELRGDRGQHRLRLNVLAAGDGNMEFAAQGGLEGSAWRGDITTLRIEHPATGPWQLANPDAEKVLQISASELQIPEHCLQGPSGRLCFGGMKDAQNWNARGSLQSVPVGVIAGLLPRGLDYRGHVSGEFRVDSTSQGIAGDAEFELTAGGIRQNAGEGAETLLGWTSGHAEVHFNGDSAEAKVDIDLLDGGTITGNGRLDIPSNAPATIDASVRASIENLQLLPSLIPELSRLQGRVTATLDVDGKLSEPRIRGEAHLRDGRARILALGTDWENVTLDLIAAGREVSMSGHAESGEGYIDIELSAADAGEQLTGKATLTGENFKVIHTPEANVNISPRLSMTLQGRDLFIDGKVLVPFARIEPRDLSTAVQPSEDQVIVNADKQNADEGLRVHVAVTTLLGDDVRVDALGLKARMEGELTVSQQPGNSATGNGRLVIVEGEYTAYGQDLTLAKGEIIYTGQPLSNPGLDIRAERTPQPDITVGVAVRGPLSQPTTTVYSDPPMSQTEALAYLLFGRSIEQATGEEEGQINEAAIALGLGGQRLLGNVGRKLGVEEIRVEDVGDRERASLVLGKYLSPDLYVSYGIGLFEAVNSFRIRYRISSKWTLEATSGLKSSADFLYTIER